MNASKSRTQISHACVPDPNCARNRRVKDARRSVTSPLSFRAISADCGDSGFGGGKSAISRNAKMVRHRTAPKLEF